MSHKQNLLNIDPIYFLGFLCYLSISLITKHVNLYKWTNTTLLEFFVVYTFPLLPPSLSCLIIVGGHIIWLDYQVSS